MLVSLTTAFSPTPREPPSPSTWRVCHGLLTGCGSPSPTSRRSLLMPACGKSPLPAPLQLPALAGKRAKTFCRCIQCGSTSCEKKNWNDVCVLGGCDYLWNIRSIVALFPVSLDSYHCFNSVHVDAFIGLCIQVHWYYPVFSLWPASYFEFAISRGYAHMMRSCERDLGSKITIFPEVSSK